MYLLRFKVLLVKFELNENEKTPSGTNCDLLPDVDCILRTDER
jgi:hypothetical protein